MCFFDQILNKTSKPGQKCHQIVIERRQKTYYGWRKNDDDEMVEVEVGRGWEIAKTINTTEEGLRLYQEQLLAEAKSAGFETVEDHEQSLLGFTDQ